MKRYPRTFKSTQPGAPVLTPTVGALIAILRQFGVTGVSMGTPDVISTVSGITTVTDYSGHQASIDSIVRLSSTGIPGLDKDHLVIGASSTAYMIATPGLADGVLTNSGFHALSPMGWTEEYSLADYAVFGLKDPNYGKCYLQVFDSDLYVSRVKMLLPEQEALAMVPKAPSDARYYLKRANGSAFVGGYQISGNDRFFYMSGNFREATNYSYWSAMYGGAFIPVRDNDRHPFMFAGTLATYGAGTNSPASPFYLSSSSAGNFLGRQSGIDNMPVAYPYSRLSNMGVSSIAIMPNDASAPYRRDFNDGKLFEARVGLAEDMVRSSSSGTQSQTLRGWLPGLTVSRASGVGFIADDSVLDVPGVGRSQILRIGFNRGWLACGREWL